MEILFDYDFVVFKAACAVENRFIKVINKKNNQEMIFKNRTELYGHHKTKSGGWLSQQSDLTLDDLDISDEREVEDVSHAIQLAKTIVTNTVEELGGFIYKGFVSGAGNFRKDICTLLPYKGNRENQISPYFRKEVAEYLVKYHNATVVDDKEPDDACTSYMYNALKTNKDIIGVINEKDYLGCDGNWYHYDNKEFINIRGFGRLYRNTKGDVKGEGRLWKYSQVCYADSSDNYAANCFSDKKNGQVQVFNRLKDCNDDKAAFVAIKEHFMDLYPEPKVITNWKGDTFEIDWLYVAQEMFNMAHLQRWDGDRINLKETFKKLGVIL